MGWVHRDLAMDKPMLEITKEIGQMVKDNIIGAMEITIEEILVMVLGMEKATLRKAKHRLNTEGSITTIRSADLDR